MIIIVCLCVNFVRNGCIMAKYLFFSRKKQNQIIKKKTIYRSKLIATYVRTLAAIDT